MQTKLVVRTLFAAAMMVGAAAQANAAEVSEVRLKEIYAMSPEQMAMTGAWTRSNID